MVPPHGLIIVTLVFLTVRYVCQASSYPGFQHLVNQTLCLNKRTHIYSYVDSLQITSYNEKECVLGHYYY